MVNTDKFMMNGHKLHWHLDRVLEWQRGEHIAPLHIDVGLGKGCNIHCHYCYGITQGNLYKKGANTYIPRNPLLRYMREAGEVGVRSMALIGESEPTLNPYLYEAIVEGKKAGVDMAVGTNGILFDAGREGEEALEHLTFLRFNISAASKDSYRKLHGSKEFDTFLEKVKFCVATKRAGNLPVTIGFQMVLTPQDVDEVVPLARLGRELGVDYLEIKQCGDTQDNTLGIYDKLGFYDQYHEVLQEAECVATDDYNVIVKWRCIKQKGKRCYNQCLGAPFLLYSGGDGNVYSCGMFFDYRSIEFCLGNIIEKGFKEIVESKHYQKVLDSIPEKIDVHKECYASCRTHAINEYLWMLHNQPAHINFI